MVGRRSPFDDAGVSSGGARGGDAIRRGMGRSGPPYRPWGNPAGSRARRGDCPGQLDDEHGALAGFGFDLDAPAVAGDDSPCLGESETEAASSLLLPQMLGYHRAAEALCCFVKSECCAVQGKVAVPVSVYTAAVSFDVVSC